MKIGILGAGQLARMLILAGKPLGMEFVLFTDKISPTTANLAEHVVGKLDDVQRLNQFAEMVDVVTYENENISVDAVTHLNKQVNVYPDVRALAVTQDRLQEKKLFRQLAIPTNDFYAVDNGDDLQKAARELGFPFIVKSRQGGYDGKHHYRITDLKALEELLKSDSLAGYIAERFVNFDREISGIAVRNLKEEIVCYDICENQHQDGILYKTINQPVDSFSQIALNYVKKIMCEFNYVGTIAVEFFVNGDGLLANEVAPRVHNSGHWTIDACYCSQFENHLRAISGLPLGNPASFAQCQMQNIISVWPDRKPLLETFGLSLHDYQKAARPGRKLGHFTRINPSEFRRYP